MRQAAEWPSRSYVSQAAHSTSRKNMLLAALWSRHRGSLLLIFAGILLQAALTVTIPAIAGSLFQSALQTDLGSLRRSATALFACYIASGIVDTLGTFTAELTAAKYVNWIKAALFRRMLRVPFAVSPQETWAEALSQITDDTTELRYFVISHVPAGIRACVILAMTTAIMATLTPFLTLTLLIATPALAWATSRVGNQLEGLATKCSEHTAATTRYAEESLRGLYSVKAFVQECATERHFTSLLGRLLTARTHEAWIFAKYTLLARIGTALLLAAGLYVVILVARERLPVGEGLSLMMYAYAMSCASQDVGRTFMFAKQVRGLGQRLTRTLGLSEERHSASAIQVDIAAPPTIAAFGLSFAYPTAPDSEVLRNITFELPSRRVTALIGASGSGKSTLCHLLLRFFEPTSGRITFDGLDIAALHVDTLRCRVAYVPQRPYVRHGSIAENVAFGRENVTMEAICTAATRAGLNSVIAGLPQGISTVVGGGDSQLSVGQLQRIGIARALLEPSPVLVLDEPTSGLDPEMTSRVESAVWSNASQQTIIIATHREELAARADHVIFLRNGRVVAAGSHDLLMRVDDDYREHWRPGFK